MQVLTYNQWNIACISTHSIQVYYITLQSEVWLWFNHAWVFIKSVKRIVLCLRLHCLFQWLSPLKDNWKWKCSNYAPKAGHYDSYSGTSGSVERYLSPSISHAESSVFISHSQLWSQKHWIHYQHLKWVQGTCWHGFWQQFEYSGIIEQQDISH